MKKIIKILGISILVFITISAISIYILYSNYKKLKTVDIENTFAKHTIPFYYSRSGHIVIDVHVQDSNRTYPFILDSGASNIIFKSNISQFNLKHNGYGIGKGANANYFFTSIKKVDSIKIESLVFKNFNVNEISHNFDCMDDIYGIIGLGLMHNFNWQIDFQNKIITVTKRLKDLSFGNQIVKLNLNENQFSHHLKIPIKLTPNSLAVDVLVDLGNIHNLNLAENEIWKDSLKLKYKKVFGTQLSGLGEGEYSLSTEKKYITDTLTLDSNFNVTNFPFSTAKNSLNLLGLGFLKKFKTTISWPHKLLILEPYETDQNFIHKTFGFNISYDDNGNIIVNSITEDTPAAKNHLKLNAELISFNNIHNIKEIDLCVLRDLIKKNDSLSLRLKTNGNIKKYKIIKEPLFE